MFVAETPRALTWAARPSAASGVPCIPVQEEGCIDCTRIDTKDLSRLNRIIYVRLRAAEGVPTLAHATFDGFLRLHARRSVTEQRGQQRNVGGQ